MSKKVNRNLRAFAVCARNVPEYDMEEEFAKAFLALADVVDALLSASPPFTYGACTEFECYADDREIVHLDCPVAALEPFLENR